MTSVAGGRHERGNGRQGTPEGSVVRLVRLSLLPPCHDDRNPSLSVRYGDDGVILLRCHAGCRSSDIVQVLRDRALWRADQRDVPGFYRREHRDSDNPNGQHARAIWQQSRPIAGTLGEAYFKSRGITTSLPGTLCFHRSLRHGPTGLDLPAIVAAVALWPSRQVIAVHRTYIDCQGRKASLSAPKMTLGPIRGGAVRLRTYGRELVLAEGIETALSVAQAFCCSAWACLSATNLMNVIVPDDVGEVTIVADHDAAGQEAASKLSDRLTREGKKVRIMLPPEQGLDWNDVLRGGRALSTETIAKAREEAPVVEPIASKPPPPEPDEAFTERLAKLSPLEYDRVRDDAAMQLGVRVATLDKEVKQRRSDRAVGGMFMEIEPWPEEVDGTVLLDEIRDVFQRYLVLPRGGAEAMALWILHSHTHDTAFISPILCFTSPTPECGKTTALSLVSALVPKSLAAANLTSSVVYRAVEKWQPTLLIDEADSFLRDNEELRGVLNSGHSRPIAFVLRNTGEDTNMEPTKFSTWAPKAIALIGKLQATLASRSVHIEMQRLAPDEAVAEYRADRVDLSPIAAKATRWARDNACRVKDIDPEMPTALSGRRADNWRHMLAIADVAGGHWPQTARSVAETLSARHSETTMGVLLLEDIKAIFATTGTDRITTSDLLEKLADMDTRPWCEFRRGKALTSRQLAEQFGFFKIAPETIRLDRYLKPKKGYKLGAFADAFARYLASDPLQRYNPQKTAENEATLSVTSDADVTDEEGVKVAENSHCNGVTAEMAPEGGVCACLHCGVSIGGDPLALAATKNGVDGWVHDACYEAFIKPVVTKLPQRISNIPTANRSNENDF